MAVKLTLGCVDFLDRTRPILEGSVAVPGVEVRGTAVKPTDLLGRYTEFDVCELALFAYLALRAMGHDEYVALPVFPHRGFTHWATAVHARSGIARPSDLNARRVGTVAMFLSGTVWMRGILDDRDGVDTASIRWVVPALPPESLPARLNGTIAARSGVRVESAAPGKSLSELLESGEIDAWIGTLPPECLERGSPSVRLLFPEYRRIERSYAKEAGFIPALHTVVVRRSALAQSPGLAGSLVELFARSREAGLARLRNDAIYACLLPWVRDDLRELHELFGADWAPAGYEQNRAVIAASLDYAARQGVTAGRHAPEEMFVW